MEIKGKNLESATAPIAWSESEGYKRGGEDEGNGRRKECGIWR